MKMLRRISNAQPLSLIEEGRTVRIKSISGGRGLKHRLYDMGLYDGVLIKILRNDASGPMILKVLDSRVMIGRGQAHKIQVEEI